MRAALSVLTALWLGLLPLVHGSSIAFDPAAFRADGLHESLGISSTAPSLAWRFTSTTRGAVQSAYQLRAFVNGELTWETELIHSNISRRQWEGRALTSRDRVSWQVQAWDERGLSTGWSEPPATFEVGLLQKSDWVGSWITNDKFVTNVTSLPYFAREFELECEEVERARLYHVGLGLGVTTMNGKNVSREVLAPGLTTYNKTVYYSTDDVTSLLQPGTNSIGIALGKSVYDAERPLDKRYFKIIGKTHPLEAIAQLEISCKDGSAQVVATSDDTWLTTVSGPLWEASWYGGEEYDARKELPGWDTVGFDRSTWTQPKNVSSLQPGSQLVPRRFPPLEIVDQWSAVEVLDKGNDTWLIDFGINYAGWYQLSMTGFPGLRVTILPAEILLDNGNITQRTTGQPKFDRYTFKSVERETYRPTFLYHGLRYLLVQGLENQILPEDATALVIRASNAQVGSFKTDNELLNGIWRILDRSVQSNMYSVMTDCPHREKLGWIEQDHLVYHAIERFYDFEAHGASIVANMRDAQLDTGLVTSTAPEYVVFTGGYRDDVNWGSAFIHLPLYLYQSYGDISILSSHYERMKIYLQYVGAKAVNFVLDGGLGDWGEVGAYDKTAKNLTATWGYARAATSLSVVASILEKKDDAETYAALARSIRDAIQTGFWNTTTNDTYDNGSQAADSFALSLGLPTEETVRQIVIEHLVSNIRSRTDHASVGEIALPSLFRSLAANGRNDVVMDILSRTDYPSYGYVLSLGATSMSEYWDGANGSSSQAHFMLGAAQEWLTTELVGLKQAEGSTGYRSVEISPSFVKGVNHVSSTFYSPQGLISISWETDTSRQFVVIKVSVPVGTKATIKLPATKLQLDGHPISPESSGVLAVRPHDRWLDVVIGSGRYLFRGVLEN